MEWLSGGLSIGRVFLAAGGPYPGHSSEGGLKGGMCNLGGPLDGGLPRMGVMTLMVAGGVARRGAT